jgi:hypothetical protein
MGIDCLPKNGANTRFRMTDSLIRIFSDEPELSFQGLLRPEIDHFSDNEIDFTSFT